MKDIDYLASLAGLPEMRKQKNSTQRMADNNSLLKMGRGSGASIVSTPNKPWRICIVIITAALLWLINPLVCTADESNACYNEYGPAQAGYVAGYRWEFKPAKHPKKTKDFLCHILLRTTGGKVVFQAEDFIVSLETVSGEDINGDGVPEIVFVGYSGGAHCCWTYWIVSLGSNPSLLKEIRNDRGVEFRRTDVNSSYELWTTDGSFDYFNDLSHADSFLPDVILRLEGKNLRDVSASRWNLYQNKIADARKVLTSDRIQEFRQVNFHDKRDYDSEYRILTVVLEELYGGRPADAWRDLRALWPPKDITRVRNEILKARRNGVLSCLGAMPASCRD